MQLEKSQELLMNFQKELSNAEAEVKQFKDENQRYYRSYFSFFVLLVHFLNNNFVLD